MRQTSEFIYDDPSGQQPVGRRAPRHAGREGRHRRSVNAVSKLGSLVGEVANSPRSTKVETIQYPGLPFEFLEKRDRSGREMHRRLLDGGQKIYLDGSLMADEATMLALFGMRDTRLLAMVKCPPPRAGALTLAEKDDPTRHQEELTTICILDVPGKSGRELRVTNMTMLQQVWRFPGYEIPGPQERRLTPGDALLLGRGSDSWLPYMPERDGATLEYLKETNRNISHKQAIIEYELDGRVSIADALHFDEVTRKMVSSKNGTGVILGPEALAAYPIDVAYPINTSDPWGDYVRDNGPTERLFYD